LYVDGVWIGMVVCEVWMKNEKMWVLVKNEHGDVFDHNWCYDSMFVVVLNVFWCMITNKQVWGWIWVKVDQNWGFWWKLYGFPRGNPKTGLCLLVQLAWWVGASHGELLRTVTHVLGVPGTRGSIRAFLNDSFDVFNCCYAFLTFGIKAFWKMFKNA